MAETVSKLRSRSKWVDLDSPLIQFKNSLVEDNLSRKVLLDREQSVKPSLTVSDKNTVKNMSLLNRMAAKTLHYFGQV